MDPYFCEGENTNEGKTAREPQSQTGYTKPWLQKGYFQQFCALPIFFSFEHESYSLFDQEMPQNFFRADTSNSNTLHVRTPGQLRIVLRGLRL